MVYLSVVHLNLYSYENFTLVKKHHLNFKNAGILLIPLVVALLFYGVALLPGRILLPTDIIVQGWQPWQQPNIPAKIHNLLQSDVVNYIFPVKQFLGETIRNGEFPLWNPYVLLGYPFTYNTQAGIFYPLTLFYYLLPAETASDLFIFTQLGLGYLFMFGYLRQLKLRKVPAIFGGILFIFNGFMVVWLEWQVVHSAVIWLPASLWLIERLYQKRLAGKNGWAEVAGSGILFAIPWLGGHWNWTLYSSLTVAIYFFVRLNSGDLPFLNWQNNKHVLLSLTAGTLITLVQVVPAYRYLAQTHRQPVPFGELLSQQGLASRGVAWVVPHFFGSSLQADFWGSAYLQRHRNQYLFRHFILVVGIPLLIDSLGLA